MKTSSLRARGLACALLATTAYCGLTAQPAAAQAAQKHRQVDANGVDVTHGDFLMNLVEGSIGSGDAELALVRIGAWYPDSQDMQGHLWERIQFKQIPVSGGGTRYTVMLGTRLETFNGTGTLPSGSSLSGSGSAFTYTTADGTKIEFTDPSGGTPNPNSQYCNGTQATCSLLPTSLISPDGKILAIGWDIFTQCWGMIEAENIPCNHFGRVASVSNSYGYEIRFAYDPNEGSGVDSPPSSSWYRRTGAGLYNNAVSTSVPQASVSYSYPSSGVTQVTDIGGRVWRITGVGGRVTAIRRPGAASDTTIIGYDGAVVSSVTADGVTTGYSRSVSGSTATMTITNALSQVSSVVSDMTIGRPTSVTDPLSRTTGFQYDSSGRLTRVTAPEGNYVEYSYDTRGNVTRTRSVAKSGSGLSDIVISASYDLTCSNPLTCNQPNSTTDARGNATHYKYNPTHGGVERVTGPAVGTVSPQTRYSYTLVNGEYRLTGVSQCQSGQEGTDTVPTTCPGTPDEVKSILTYDSNGNLITTTTGNGSNTLTASVIMTYDALGNRLTVDGPLPGSDDTTRFRYNSGRQPIGSVSPDPDGSGALKHRAVRNVIDGATGLLTRTETGTVNSQSDTDWAAFTPIQAAETDYDSNARPVKQRLTAGGTIHALTQTSYDALGRPQCVVQRMNKAIFATISTGACSLGSQGSGADDFGPDRIVKTVYDAAGQVMQVRTAVGTSLEAAEATMAYRDNGQAEYLIDANGNRTQYVYDGHDRLSQTRYPSATGPSSFNDSTPANALATAGSVNINDYEEQGYDAAGNVTGFRNRANQTIAFTHDALGRVTLKDLPGSEPDVSFAYDNLGRVTSASQSGSSLTFTWDALGRKLTEAGSHGTLTSTWDITGRRTRLAHPDGAYFDHAYLVTGELVSITEGGTSTPGSIAAFDYDDLGRRITLTRGNGTSTSYAYDAVSRLQSLGHSFPAASSNNLTLGFAYNPASQIVTNTRSNDLYSWTGHGSGSLSSPANGLNQIISLDAAPIGHDTKGNLTSEGGRSFSYSSENLLTGFVGPTHTHIFRYDPLMRLRQLETPNIVRRHYIRDGDDLVREYNDNTFIGRHVHGPGADEPLYSYRASDGRRWWYHADERGSIVAASLADGTVWSRAQYDEYGRQTGSGVGFAFAGKSGIGVTGLLYSNARFYDPKLGRFVQPDPIGYDDGPNMYAYVGADPVNFRDPTGLEARGFGESHTVTGSLGGFSVTPTSLMFGRLGAMRTAKINESDDIADRLSSRECETDTGETCSGPVDGFKPRDPLTSGPLYHSPSPAPPASDGRHRYRVRTVTLCNPREAFNRMRGPGLSAPGAPYAREGFRRGIVLTGNNPISQLVDSKAMTITNFTQEGHTFHKGAVHIQVSPGGGRTSVITVTGTGTGKNPVLNYILGMAFFAMTTDNVARSCTPGNDGLVP